MSRAMPILLLILLFLTGCVDQVIRITSSPTDAEVYSNRSRLGNTPLVLTKDDIMPLWGYYGSFEQVLITIRKPGFQDYILYVNELHLPGKIHAALVPLPAAAPPP